MVCASDVHVYCLPCDAYRANIDTCTWINYQGVRCAACMAVCNETKHLLDDLDKKHYSTKTKDKFGGHYDSAFHSKMVDDLVCGLTRISQGCCSNCSFLDCFDQAGQCEQPLLVVLSDIWEEPTMHLLSGDQ